MKRMLPLLLLFMFTHASACDSSSDQENITDTDQNNAEENTSNNNQREDVEEDLSEQDMPSEDISDEADMPQADVPPAPNMPQEDMPITEVCGELNIQTTLGSEHIQDNGNYQISNLTPQNSLFTDQCPASDPSVTRGGESIVRFIAPRKGAFTFESSRGVSQMALLTTCENTEEPLSCSSAVSHHSTAFSDPRRIRQEMEQGDEVLIVMDSVVSATMGLTVHTPFTEGQYCITNSNGYIQRACAQDLWCDWGAIEEEDRVCRASFTPEITGIEATVGDHSLQMSIQGMHNEARGIHRVQVVLYDAQGNILSPVQDQETQQLYQIHQWSKGRTDFNLHTSLVLPLEFGEAINIATIDVNLISNTGGHSNVFHQEISQRQEVSIGQSCDPYRVQQVCAQGSFCTPTTEGAFQCTTPPIVAWHDSENLYVGAQVPVSEEIAPSLQLFLFKDGDLTRPSSSIGYYANIKDPEQGTLKSRINDEPARSYHIAFGYPNGAWDTPSPLQLSTPTPLEEGSRCDGDRVMNRCQEGAACKPVASQDTFTCQTLHAPVVDEVTWYAGENNGLGFIMQATDINNDITSIIVEPVLNGEVQRAITVYLTSPNRERVRHDEDTIEIHWSTPSRVLGRSFRLYLQDTEGLVSATTEPVIPEAMAQESEQGQICDRYEVLQTCSEGLACDWVPGDELGFSCHAIETTCPQDWPVQTLTHEPGARNITQEGDLLDGQDLGPGCYNNSLAHDTLYHFVSQEAAYHRFEVVTREFQNPFLTLRRHCALPNIEEPVCIGDGSDHHIGYSVLETWLEAGEEAYLFLGSDRTESTPYTLTVSW